MLEIAARFDALPWFEAAPCAREKVFRLGDTRVRLLEIRPGFRDDEWCTRAHAGYVLHGEVEMELPTRRITLVAGDALILPAAPEYHHKATPISARVVLLLVERVDP